MNISKITAITAALSASLLLNPARLTAQDARQPAPSDAPAAQSGTTTSGGAGGAQDIMQQILARRDASIKTALKATDDEWTVIQPLLDKVEQAQFSFMMSGNMGFGLGGGRPRGNGGNGGNGGTGGAGGGNNPLFQGSPQSQALSDAVQSDSTSNDDLKAKMAAVRDARKKAQDDLAAARTNLQKVLTLRQEAVLLNMGVLD